MTLAADIGMLTVKVTTGETVAILPAPTGGSEAAMRAALAVGGGGDGLCVAIPDAWLSGDAAGAARQEEVRHLCEDVAGTGLVTWTGQLAAVAAVAAGPRGSGRYLVCDAGGTGVRAGMFAVSDGDVEILATHAAEGGWRGFDRAVRSGAPGELPATWYEQAVRQAGRATDVLADAVTDPADYADTRVYRISGRDGGDVDLAADLLITCFAPVGQRLRAAIEAVAGAGLPAAADVVLTGGLAWFPLAARAVTEVTGIVPALADVDAAARGALLLARGQARLAPPAACPPVALPAHHLRNGLLEEVIVTLPWTEPFAAMPGGTVVIDRDKLDLTVDGERRTFRLPGLAAGPHRVGLRPAWPGPGTLVVRPAAGGSAHIIPLAAGAAS